MSGIPSWARVGAKCVCIEHCEWSNGGPAMNEVCTISGVNADARGVWLYLERYDQWVPYSEGRKSRSSFDVGRFRPLITQQDDLETHFKALLDVPEQVGA